jgi:amidase
MARGAKDLEVSLGVTAGAHGPASRGWKLELPACEKQTLKDFRVAVMADAVPAPVDGEIRDAIGRLAEFLEGRGATVDRTARPEFDLEEVSRDTTLLIRGATSGKLPAAEFDTAWRVRNERPESDDAYPARYARGIAAFHREWLVTHNRRFKRGRAWEEFFARWDLLICPPASTAAFRHDHSQPRDARVVMVDGKPRASIEQVFWAGLAGSTYLPATVAPLARTAGGLPIGVQIIGPLHGDLTCLRFARLLERDYRGFEPPPQLALS